MSTVRLTAGQVMDIVASALLNDASKSQYTYAVQVPYLKIAMDELQELYELNSIPSTSATSAVIQVDAGETQIGFEPGHPQLPSDFIEPNQLWERIRDTDPFIPMTKRDFLPHYLEGVENNQFIYFTWNGQKIEFLSSNANNDIKIDYVKTLFPEIVDENSRIDIINAKTFLEFRTAGLISEFIEHNDANADSNNSGATLALDRSLGIGSKGKQSIMTRRKPFRRAYKRYMRS